VNHPALVKTSDQPLFNSSNFSPFASPEALRSSSVPVPILNLQPNTRGGTAKKTASSPYKKFVAPTQKKKIKQATKSEALLGPLKDGEEGFAGIQLHLTLHQIWTLTYLFLSLTILRKKRNNTLIVCTVLVVSLKTAMEKSG